MTPRPRVIFADPAWPFNDKLRMSAVKRGAEANYSVMSIDDIAGMPVRHIAAEDSVLVLWRPSSLAAEGLRVMQAWGYRQVGEIVWRKTTKKGGVAFGMGRLTRAAKEVAFVGVRGKVQPHLRSRSERDIFDAPAMPHSRKPECVQDAFTRMFPDGPFLELFARRERPGWTCWGNEAPATLGRDIRDVMIEQYNANLVSSKSPQE